MKLIGFLLLSIPVLAQTSVKDALSKHWKVSTDFTISVAKLMPEASYGFKPVPEELSFAQVLIQVIGRQPERVFDCEWNQAPGHSRENHADLAGQSGR